MKLTRLIGICAILAIWEIAARLNGSPMLPPASLVLVAWFRLATAGSLWVDIATSLRIVVIGFFCASVAGFLLGVLIAQRQTAEDILMPVVDAVRGIAALTMFPVLILLFGLGITAKVVVIMWTAWPSVVLSTIQAIWDVDHSVTEAATLDGADEGVMLRRISVPLAAPVILTGMRIGLSGGWISLVAAEMLGSSAGLGYAVLSYSQTFRFPEMYATILTIAVIGLILNVALGRVQRKIEWRPRNRSRNKRGSK